MNTKFIRNAAVKVVMILPALALLGIALTFGCQRAQPPHNTPSHLGASVGFEPGGAAFAELIQRIRSNSNNKHILINTGSSNETVNYYSEIGGYLGLELVSQSSSGGHIINTNFTLNSLIQYCGFQDAHGVGLSAVALDHTPGTVLNDPDSLEKSLGIPAFAGPPPFNPGEVLAATFFAPKICDVGLITGSNGAATTPQKYGWRKAVLLRPRDGSSAKNHQIVGVWILFNYFVPPDAIAIAPLIVSNSVNTQVMLVFDTIQNISVPSPAQSPDVNAAFWLDFNATKDGAQLNDALNATFDSGEPDWDTNTARNYFVPTACAACHGGDRPTAALNFLDTDHWFERVRTNAPAGCDFAPMADSPNGVLLDGGKDLASPQFTNAFTVFQTLNQKISQQNHMSGASIQTASVDYWLSAHANSIFPLTLAQRALGSSGNTWTAADETLLSHFDRYCYRCHNAIDYNVFSKADVLDEKGIMVRRLKLPWVPQNFQRVMPQDRHLDDQVINTLTNLISAIH